MEISMPRTKRKKGASNKTQSPASSSPNSATAPANTASSTEPNVPRYELVRGPNNEHIWRSQDADPTGHNAMSVTLLARVETAEGKKALYNIVRETYEFRKTIEDTSSLEEVEALTDKTAGPTLIFTLINQGRQQASIILSPYDFHAYLTHCYDVTNNTPLSEEQREIFRHVLLYCYSFGTTPENWKEGYANYEVIKRIIVARDLETLKLFFELSGLSPRGRRPFRFDPTIRTPGGESMLTIALHEQSFCANFLQEHVAFEPDRFKADREQVHEFLDHEDTGSMEFLKDTSANRCLKGSDFESYLGIPSAQHAQKNGKLLPALIILAYAMSDSVFHSFKKIKSQNQHLKALFPNKNYTKNELQRHARITLYMVEYYVFLHAENRYLCIADLCDPYYPPLITEEMLVTLNENIEKRYALWVQLILDQKLKDPNSPEYQETKALLARSKEQLQRAACYVLRNNSTPFYPKIFVRGWMDVKERSERLLVMLKEYLRQKATLKDEMEVAELRNNLLANIRANKVHTLAAIPPLRDAYQLIIEENEVQLLKELIHYAEESGEPIDFLANTANGEPFYYLALLLGHNELAEVILEELETREDLPENYKARIEAFIALYLDMGNEDFPQQSYQSWLNSLKGDQPKEGALRPYQEINSDLNLQLLYLLITKYHRTLGRERMQGIVDAFPELIMFRAPNAGSLMSLALSICHRQLVVYLFSKGAKVASLREQYEIERLIRNDEFYFLKWLFDFCASPRTKDQLIISSDYFMALINDLSCNSLSLLLIIPRISKIEERSDDRTILHLLVQNQTLDHNIIHERARYIETLIDFKAIDSYKAAELDWKIVAKGLEISIEMEVKNDFPNNKPLLRRLLLDGDTLSNGVKKALMQRMEYFRKNPVQAEKTEMAAALARSYARKQHEATRTSQTTATKPAPAATPKSRAAAKREKKLEKKKTDSNLQYWSDRAIFYYNSKVKTEHQTKSISKILANTETFQRDVLLDDTNVMFCVHQAIIRDDLHFFAAINTRLKTQLKDGERLDVRMQALRFIPLRPAKAAPDPFITALKYGAKDILNYLIKEGVKVSALDKRAVLEMRQRMMPEHARKLYFWIRSLSQHFEIKEYFKDRTQTIFPESAVYFDAINTQDDGLLTDIERLAEAQLRERILTLRGNPFNPKSHLKPMTAEKIRQLLQDISPERAEMLHDFVHKDEKLTEHYLEIVIEYRVSAQQWAQKEHARLKEKEYQEALAKEKEREMRQIERDNSPPKKPSEAQLKAIKKAAEKAQQKAIIEERKRAQEEKERIANEQKEAEKVRLRAEREARELVERTRRTKEEEAQRKQLEMEQEEKERGLMRMEDPLIQRNRVIELFPEMSLWSQALALSRFVEKRDHCALRLFAESFREAADKKINGCHGTSQKIISYANGDMVLFQLEIYMSLDNPADFGQDNLASLKEGLLSLAKHFSPPPELLASARAEPFIPGQKQQNVVKARSYI